MKQLSLNGRFLGQPITGVQRYAREVLGALVDSGEPLDLHLPKGCEVNAAFGAHVCVLSYGHLRDQAWEQLALGLSYRGVLLNLCNTYPVLAGRQLVVVHDAAVYMMPQGYTRAFVAFYRLLFWLLRFKRGTRIVTDSEFSRRELARCAGWPLERIEVVHCGIDHWRHVSPDITVLERLGMADGRPFVLAVASDNPNKNLARLIEAFLLLGRANLRLVLVGGRNSRVFASGPAASAENIVRPGHLTDSELAALYASARCFVFPSLYEGFGLPPLEAMSFGCPVLVSREASLPEVCGDAALYCDARDVADITTGMARLLDDPELRQRLALAGREQASRFKWRDTAQALLRIAGEIA